MTTAILCVKYACKCFPYITKPCRVIMIHEDQDVGHRSRRIYGIELLGRLDGMSSYAIKNWVVT